MYALLVVVIVLGIILEVFSLRRDASKIEVDSVVSTNFSEPGMPFNVRTTITNRSLLPISYLAIKEVYPSAAILPASMSSQQTGDGLLTDIICRIGGRHRKRLMIEVVIEKRGVHLIRGKSVECGDFLGFHENVARIYHQQEIIVYPERLDWSELTDALGSFFGDIASKRFLIRDPVLTAGCREYTGREPMKEIHWPKSAHRGELMVREFEYNRQLTACVVMSVDGLSALDDEELDRCCAAARTICETLVKKGVSVSFFTNSRLKRKDERGVWKCEVSLGHAGGLLEGLGRVSSYACCPVDKLLESAHHQSTLDAAFVVIVPACESRGEEAANRLRHRTGREVLLVGMSQFGRSRGRDDAAGHGDAQNVSPRDRGAGKGEGRLALAKGGGTA